MAAILIVEDGLINRRLLVTLLQGHGHRLLEASKGEEALRVVRSRKPDLVLIDILTPSIDGCEFVQKLRAEPEAARPRVLLRGAAHIEAEARALASALGASFVATPTDPETLLAAVDRALSERPPGEPDRERGSIDGFLGTIARRLQSRVANLEQLNAQLSRGILERNAQLEVARSALDQEIEKRLWAEQNLTEANRRLRDQVVHDELTGLYNRRYLEESFGREESRARRSGQPLGVLMIDIDNFKRFNDTLGHAAGDAVLRAMGQYLLSAARGEDIVCRYGGEEFVLVMTQAPHSTVLDRAEKLRRGVQGLEIEYDGRLVGPITISVGVAIFPDHGESGQAVLLSADTAMYRAKQSGRNRVFVGDKVKA